MLVFTLTRDRH